MASAANAGLDVVALTDHDTTGGWAEAAAAVQRTGVALVRGTEISCKAEGLSVHLLSYLHDPAHPALAQELERSRASRLTRAEEMVARIAEDYPITWEDVRAQTADGATIGRPHIADALVVAGVVEDRAEAFASVLSPRTAYYVRYYAPEATEVIEAVLEAGGVPVIAHPRAGVRGRVVSDAAIAEMAEAGLMGLEVHHRDHTAAERAQLTALATELGLACTGSSDYHGAGKPNRLGENLTEPAVFDLIEAAGRLKVVRP